MAMTHRDFLLTDEELSKITRYFSEMADSYAQAREDPPQSVSVTFEFMPGYGRTVVAKFDGELNGRTISEESEDQLPEATDGEAQNGTANESDRERLAKHGFFISEDIEGSAEADALANAFANLINSVHEGKSDKG